MHKIIMWLFRNTNNIAEIFSLLCAFFILATTLYWLENIFKTYWGWLNFVKPALDTIIEITNNVIPVNKFLNVPFDMRYFVSIVELIVLMVLLRFFLQKLNDLQETYSEAHFQYKLNKERSFNKQLGSRIEKEEKQISKYMILIHTKLQKKFSHQEINIDVDEQNKIMNEYIENKTNVHHTVFSSGFLYSFDNFEKIDDVIDVMFKVLKSKAPLDYSICVQEGTNLKQIAKLSSLELYGKIIMCADTLLRYKYKKSHRYGTQSLGIYQKGEGTIEVHEFNEIL